MTTNNTQSHAEVAVLSPFEATIELVSNYVKHNPVTVSEFPGLVKNVFAAITDKASAAGPMTAPVIAEVAAPAVARKRGRPRKHPLLNTTATEVVAQEEAAPVVRKRGRPRKHPIIENAVKRGRGRPRLEDVVSIEEFSHLSKEPFVPVEESVQPDYLICLIDGTKKTMLKRYLDTVHGMSWAQYKKFYDLPRDYPSCAPNYSDRKRSEAETVGLGQMRRQDEGEAVSMPLAA